MLTAFETVITLEEKILKKVTKNLVYNFDETGISWIWNIDGIPESFDAIVGLIKVEVFV